MAEGSLSKAPDIMLHTLLPLGGGTAAAQQAAHVTIDLRRKGNIVRCVNHAHVLPHQSFFIDSSPRVCLDAC